VDKYHPFTLIFLGYGLLILLLLIFTRGIKWKKIFFAIHSILLTLLSGLIFFIVLSTVHKDRIVPDGGIRYQSIGGSKKVVFQGEGKKEKEYLIETDFHFIRKRRQFTGELPDGKWMAMNKEGVAIAELNTKNGKVTERKHILPFNTIIVKNPKEITNSMSISGMTFLLKGNYNLQETIVIDGAQNLKIEAMPQEAAPQILSNGLPCFRILNSRNIKICDLSFKANNTKAIIEIVNCENISIDNSQFWGEAENSISIDSESRDIFLKNNKFQNYNKSAIKACTYNTHLESNEYLRNGKKENLLALNFDDKKIDLSTGFEIIENVLLNFNDKYYRNEQKNTIVLWGKTYPKYEGTIEELLYSYNTFNTIKKHLKTNYYSECNCTSYYCYDFFEKITKIPLFSNKNASHDTWCYTEDGKAKFSFVNPAFFKWIRTHLVFPNDYTIHGVSFSSVYHELFQNFFRNYYCAYMHLKNIHQLDEKIQKYKSFVDTSNWSTDLDLFVFREYADTENTSIEYQYYETTTEANEETEMENFDQNSNIDLYESVVSIDGEEINAKLFSKLSSFWIRRMIDGSAQEISRTIEYYLKQYDKDWVNSVNASYKNK
jgi:hypothetical protein